ncbi:MAG: hypothetical protein GF411_14785 [Candidatus Lokiarchaeota archaeon]|nr:hypothetical protein [Candidatus Lokiarchaeota archaeon]
MHKFTVSKNVQVVLDGHNILLEKGDIIVIESNVEVDDKYYDKEVENPVVMGKFPKTKERLRRRKDRSHLEKDESTETYEYDDINKPDGDVSVTTNLPTKKASD